MKKELDRMLRYHNIKRQEVRRIMDYARKQLTSSQWTPGFDFIAGDEMLRFDIFMKGSRIWYEICNEDGEVICKNSWSLDQEDEEPLDEIVRYYLILREKEVVDPEEWEE